MRPETRARVLLRDGSCVAALLDKGHGCRDKWGRPHPPTDLESLTLEHVKDEPMMGKRAPSDPAHLVAMCWSANVVTHWVSAHRDLLRAYLVGVGRAA